MDTLSEENHPRIFRNNTYVYPVLSRRSGGVSIGVNLNPDKACNFDCIYCQVDRTKTPQEYFVGLQKLLGELDLVLQSLSPVGALWHEPEFSKIPKNKRHITDIAFSGDGEPTAFKNFSEVISNCAALKHRLGLNAVKLVLITNTTGLDRPDVRQGLACMDQNNGEVWAKLDAGTAEYFKQIDQTDFPFQKVIDNIVACATARAVVIQSCFMRIQGIGPTESEIGAYIERLEEIVSRAGNKRAIQRVQVYTVARHPAYSIVSSLSDSEVDQIALRVRRETGLIAETFYGAVPEGRGTADSSKD